MRETGTASFRDAYERIEEALSSSSAAQNKSQLKAEIIALFREVDRELGELGALKDEIKGLVTRWKSIRDGGDPQGPMPDVAPTPTVPEASSTNGNAHAGHSVPQLSRLPAPTRADHLNASSFIEKGWSLISLGEHEAAEQALTKALSLVPGDTQAAALLGWAEMLQGKYDSALLHFQHVLQREPMNALARVNVGYICLRKGIFGEAIEHLSRTIKLDNDRKATLYAHFYLGLLYFERDMPEDAETFLCKAIDLGPNLVEAWFELGRVRWFAGHRDAARQAWRDGAAANKFSPWGKRCAEMLQHVDAGGAPSR